MKNVLEQLEKFINEQHNLEANCFFKNHPVKILTIK